MIVTIASFKGGVGKTTTAVHLAAYLAPRGTTLLIDGDPNRSATRWAERGGLPFQVVDERKAAKYARAAEHIVIDTQARPEQEDLEALADGCDRLIIPCTPDALALDAMMLTVKALHQLGSDKYRILLTIIPPKPSKDGEEAKNPTVGLAKKIIISSQPYQLKILPLTQEENLWRFELSSCTTGGKVPEGFKLRLLTENLESFAGNEDIASEAVERLFLEVSLDKGESLVWEIEPTPENYQREVLHF